MSSKAAWRTQRERSNLPTLRLMVWISLSFGRRLSRLVLYGIALYFTLFAPRARQASRPYLQRALGRTPGWRDHFRHILAFASTIHDRIYFLNGRTDQFDIEVYGAEILHAALAEQPGALLIGAHLGSFEALRVLGRERGGLAVAMLMHPDNARKIAQVLAAINPAAQNDILPLGQPDSMLAARDRLDAGHLVGMLADRGLGEDPKHLAPFLGQAAAFPLGPWKVAALLRRPVFFMVALYLGGRRYRIHLEPLADFSRVAASEREAAMHAAIERYAERLSQHCRQTPYNWFNFYDFWKTS
ncbi:acyl-CoA synthetase [Azonexus sp.]|uniref:LpxL/LpxP family acyltransferase n=1 Tax=Azonexus sp. TaxID=1872668 RepID=UPI0039E56898